MISVSDPQVSNGAWHQLRRFDFMTSKAPANRRGSQQRASRSPACALGCACIAALLGLALLPVVAEAETTAAPAGQTQSASNPIDRVDALVQRLILAPVVLTVAADNAPGTMTEQDVVETFGGKSLAVVQADKLWELLASEAHSALLTVPIVKALLIASDTPNTRDAFWSELGGLAKSHAKSPQTGGRARSLLGFVERHRAVLAPLYGGLRDTESSGDEMVDLMTTTKVLGANLDEGLDWLAANNIAAVARRLERERGLGRPVAWEKKAFDHMLRWKKTHLVPGAAKPPRSLGELDAAGWSFVVIFNSLHAFDEKYRKNMLVGLGPVEVFNAAVAGELELYRLGTSSYRDFMHDIIMRGITESGSFEAFLERAAPKKFGEEAIRAAPGRGMVLLRIVSSFGLLEDVLVATRDRGRFVSDAIASLSDPEAFEGNASVMLDLLTLRSKSTSMQEFQRTLLSQLYERYGAETGPRLRNVYGSILSVYQTVTGNRREAAIDLAFPIDDRRFRVPFARLFSPDGRGGHVHRMFMRFDQDVDATATYASFLALMRSRRASVRHERDFDVYRLAQRNRVVEIYANKPTADGLKSGLAGITAALSGKRVETIIGRGHTAIVTPLQRNARQILGGRISEVATVIVGTCGGDASVRDLIATFGYNSFFTTRSTGRQALNNSLVDSYVDALLDLTPTERLDLDDVLDDAVEPFFRKGADSGLRDDASFYRVSTSLVLAAYLFDTHVKPQVDDQVRVAK